MNFKECYTKSIFIEKAKIMLFAKLYFYINLVFVFNHLEAWTEVIYVNRQNKSIKKFKTKYIPRSIDPLIVIKT